MTDATTGVRRYRPDDDDQLYALLEREGAEWKDYWHGGGWARYQRALTSSVVFVLVADDELCGYVRCRDDDGFGVYVHDLLVDRAHRGKHHGRALLDHVCAHWPDETVYVMSDVDPYYEKLGYSKEGSIFVAHASGVA
ncbi:MAG: GNAT family N-acetyltransferase [Micrococcales bacterium]|nr:GNAT family N-acetyltransferase [Micrococcales bacterium]